MKATNEHKKNKQKSTTERGRIEEESSRHGKHGHIKQANTGKQLSANNDTWCSNQPKRKRNKNTDRHRTKQHNTNTNKDEQ